MDNLIVDLIYFPKKTCVFFSFLTVVVEFFKKSGNANKRKKETLVLPKNCSALSICMLNVTTRHVLFAGPSQSATSPVMIFLLSLQLPFDVPIITALNNCIPKNIFKENTTFNFVSERS